MNDVMHKLTSLEGELQKPRRGWAWVAGEICDVDIDNQTK